MKIKKIFAALAAASVSAVSFASMAISTASAEGNPVLGKAQFIGAIGAEECWNIDSVNDLSVAADVNGDAQYEVVWDVSATGGTGTLQFLAVMIAPVEGVDNFAVATFPDLTATIDEVWIDDVLVEDYAMSADAVNTNYFESGAGVTRLYLRDEWAGTGVSDLPSDTTITDNIRVKFTVSGLGVDGDSNVTADPTGDTAEDPTDAPEDDATDAPADDTTEAPADDDADADAESTTAADDGDAESTTAAAEDKDDDKKDDTKSTTEAKKDSSSSKSTTKAASNGGSDEKSADTGDAGVGIAIAAIALAGTAAVVSRKRK